MYKFDNVELTTFIKQPVEEWVEQSRLGVKNPTNNPKHIEFQDYKSGVFVKKYNTFFEYLQYLKDSWFGENPS